MSDWGVCGCFRYVQVFGRLLTHQIRMNSSPLFIYGINIHPIPDFHPTGDENTHMSYIQSFNF